jgi:hypothetical protein
MNTGEDHLLLCHEWEDFAISMNNSRPGDLRDAKIWKDAGDAHFHKGDFESAKKCYTQAIDLDPGYKAAWNNLGLSLLKSGNIEEAKQVNARLKMLPQNMTLKDKIIPPINTDDIQTKPIWKKIIIIFVGVIAAIFVILILAAFINGMSGPVDQSVIVTVAPTPDGMNIAWQGGMDIDHVVGWKVFGYSSGEELLLIDGTGNIPTIGQVNRYSGGSITGKRILIRVWFDDGSEEVIYDR